MVRNRIGGGFSPPPELRVRARHEAGEQNSLREVRMSSKSKLRAQTIPFEPDSPEILTRSFGVDVQQDLDRTQFFRVFQTVAEAAA